MKSLIPTHASLSRPGLLNLMFLPVASMYTLKLSLSSFFSQYFIKGMTAGGSGGAFGLEKNSPLQFTRSPD